MPKFTRVISTFMKNNSSKEREPGDAQSLYSKDEEMLISCSQNYSRETINK